jgi:pimeloyl-ACP methyl ester carboxylesterase
VLLCVVGFLLARAPLFRETTVIVDAGGCRMVTDIVDAGDDEVQGSVVLLHGLAANRKIMSFVARGFALQNLRVFVPDLPGHGRTPGPFSYGRAESCSDSFVRQLIGRGAIDPKRTILAGHSMGGAIAEKIAARVPIAGVIAISPAPMVTTYGVPESMLIFTNPPPAPPHMLVLSGALEPRSVRESARALVDGENEATGKYEVISRATHAGVLSSRDVVAASQQWAGQVLGIDTGVKIPPRFPLIGGFAGLVGIFLLAGPFLREALGKNSLAVSSEAAALLSNVQYDGVEPQGSIVSVSALVVFAAASLATVLLLRTWNPFHFFRLFEGDYLAGFLLILGVGLLAFHYKKIRDLWHFKPMQLVGAAFAAVVVPLLIYAWMDLTLTEAWWTPSRWLRFPAVIVAVLPFHIAEELTLGPMLEKGPSVLRLAYALLLRAIAWAALLVGILALHNGEILILLMAPYFALFCLLQRTGMDVVRSNTGSALAAALFGAILLAGFCVVVFPIS